MKKEGQILKELIENSPMEITAIAQRMGVSRAQIYILFTKDVIDDKYKQKLIKMGINIGQNDNPAPSMSKILDEFKMLKQEMDLLKREIALLTKEINLIDRQNDIT